MSTFSSRYQNLNSAQKKAVDTIDGPLMVVAGPGTGKTELLGVRVANILAKTDTLPQNILLLTFTESGAAAMRERLVGLVGNEANKVAIHTFHSFGSEIINSYGSYFYQGAQFSAANDLSSYEVIAPILSELPHGSNLKSQLNGKFSYLNDLKSAISHLKKGGLSPEEFEAILSANQSFTEWLKPKLPEVFGGTMSKKLFPAIGNLVEEMRAYEPDETVDIGYKPLHTVLADGLSLALTQAEEIDKTTPLTAWKKHQIEKDTNNQPILKDEARLKKMFELASVYRQYLARMQAEELYDYDDMILRVIHALELNDELRYQLQETYQYIMVDEFQDTNEAQMRLLWNLTNNPVLEGKPNLMVVGDDDQAIYRFQGAEMSNILGFTTKYSDVTVVTLTDNYRSDASILDLARQVITQADERLEYILPHVDKTLSAQTKPDKPEIATKLYDSTVAMRSSLAEQLRNSYQKDPLQTKAIIARNHRQLQALLPHLLDAGVPLRYEHEENILESEPIEQLELVATIVSLLSQQRLDDAQQYLPQLLSHPAWGLDVRTIWQLSLEAYRQKITWLEVMLTREDKLADIATWLVQAATMAHFEPLEIMLDHLFGTEQTLAAETEHDENEPFSDAESTAVHEGYSSPLRSYFFPAESLETSPAQYLTYLGNVRALRDTLREFRPDKPLRLDDMILCLSMHRELGLSIRSSSEIAHDETAVTLLTAHKAKGLEFDSVYIVDAVEEIWGARARRGHSKLSFPYNMPLAPAGESNDERLRLLFVALTRAKRELQILTTQYNDAGKATAPIGAFDSADMEPEIMPSLETGAEIKALETDWKTPHLDVAIATKEQLLRPALERYKLSATHLNNFVDITQGGPQLFLLHNLLHFPQAMSPSAAYGSAIHGVLQLAHQHLAATKELKPLEDTLGDFERKLTDYRLSDHDYESLLERGNTALTTFMNARADSFSPTQQVEHSFSHESIVVDDVRLSGAIDLLDIDDKSKTIKVTDYKTGKALSTWQGKSVFEKIKLHKYEQQLMFYKILIENSRQYAGYTVTSAALEFIEPDPSGEIIILDYSYDDEACAAFRQLLVAVWQRIQSLDFSIDGDYKDDFTGVIVFEHDLIDSLNSDS